MRHGNIFFFGAALAIVSKVNEELENKCAWLPSTAAYGGGRDRERGDRPYEKRGMQKRACLFCVRCIRFLCVGTLINFGTYIW